MPDPTPQNLEFYRRRDEFMRGYHPANAEQRLLLKQACHAWLHLEDLHQLRVQLMAGATLFDYFQNNREEYKLITRHLAEAERMWRHSIEAYHKAQRHDPASRPTPRPAAKPREDAINQEAAEPDGGAIPRPSPNLARGCLGATSSELHPPG